MGHASAAPGLGGRKYSSVSDDPDRGLGHALHDRGVRRNPDETRESALSHSHADHTMNESAASETFEKRGQNWTPT